MTNLRGMAIVLSLIGFAGLRPETFAAEPSSSSHWPPFWEGYRHQLLPNPPRVTQQDFGYSTTHHAQGGSAGEIGGIVQRSLTPARYVLKLQDPLTFDDIIQASGRLFVRQNEGASGALIGFRSTTSRGWRTNNSLAFRVDGNGPSFWVFYEYGTQNGMTGGGGAFEGERYQTTPTKPFRVGDAALEWNLRYQPVGSTGRITFQVAGRTYQLEVPAEHRADGTLFDEFGIWNQETTGDAVELWLDDLVVQGTRHEFDDEPSWESGGNRVTFPERIRRPFHQLDITRSNPTEPWQIGGVLFRDEKPAYLADRIRPLTLNDDLDATGILRFDAAGADSGVYLGWFNAHDKQRNETPEHEKRQPNYLALLLEGPSRVGHYLRPGYSTQAGQGRNASTGPVILPNSKPHRWSLRYRPNANGGRGLIIATVDGNEQRLELNEGDRANGATFDRFGLFNMQSGGWHVEAYIQDLEYTGKRH